MLSDDERWRLWQLERQLADDDPALSRALTRFEPVRRWRYRLATAAMLSGACGIPAGLLARDLSLMLLTVSMLGVGAGLWYP
ncbi:DUF3040 domain-containing protein [Dactylosporangium sp. CA-092794]|uniref:DUF3040 domain-containing protein n=1 Tax=Dactylosporangium sp. CA-092794 TaxID=3239929 RepID=UPI003D94B32E